MSERDELADIIYRGNYNNPASPFIQPLKDRTQDEIDRTRKTADAILAAGYRKARTITTAEELDGLGNGSAILDASGVAWINDGDSTDEWGSISEDYGGGPIWAGGAEIALPATVLYEPRA